jgi:hypothetical protein
MPTYNVRAGYGEGGRMVRIYSFECESDANAEAFVLERMTADAVELWCRSRKLARFEGKRPC